MSRISNQYLDCVFYLYPSVPDAEKGTPIGGTGFLVSTPSTDSQEGESYFAVTNKHIIQNGNVVFRFNTIGGESECVDTDERSWILSQTDDLAIKPIESDDVHNYKVRSVPVSMFITEDLVERHDIGPGDDTFTVGRFINAEGRQRNVPSVRFGSIAQMGSERVKHKAGFGMLEQESLLVEARSIPGYSGSPVFLTIPALSWRPNTGEKGKYTTESFGPCLLGIDWAHLYDYVAAVDANGSDLNYKIASNSGIMAVIPAWRLLKFLKSNAR